MLRPRLSIVMTMKDRTELLYRSLQALCYWQRFESEQAELVIVDDQSEDSKALLDTLRNFRKYFYQIQLITMDKRRSKIPVLHNNPALGINIGVKAAENEIVYKTDPECLPLTDTVLNALSLFREETVWFFSVRMLTEQENQLFSRTSLLEVHPADIHDRKLADLPDLWLISQRNRRAYWFGSVFSRSRFLSIGGVDEQFLRGFAGEDDDWAERMQRSGATWRWTDELKILHQFHGTVNKEYHLSPGHHHNINLLRESRQRARVVANEGHDWGSDEVVVGRKTIQKGQIHADRIEQPCAPLHHGG